MVRELPSLLGAFLGRAIPGGPPWPRAVRLRQEGEMRLRPGGRWRRFMAVQTLHAERTAFVWHARTRVLGLPVRALDRIDDGNGEFRVSLFGLPLARAEGALADVGERMRYLAELPWNPGALVLNPALRAAAVDDRSVDVRATDREAGGVIRLHLSEEGDVVGSSGVRPRSRSEPAVPWGGDFADYETIGRLRVPTRATVGWDAPGGRFDYFRGRVVALSTE